MSGSIANVDHIMIDNNIAINGFKIPYFLKKTSHIRLPNLLVDRETAQELGGDARY